MAHSKNAFQTLCGCVYQFIKSSYFVPPSDSKTATAKTDPEIPESKDNN